MWYVAGHLTAVLIKTQHKRKDCLSLYMYHFIVLKFSAASIHYYIQSSECTYINHTFSNFALVLHLLWGNILGSVTLEHFGYESDISLYDRYIFFYNILACCPDMIFLFSCEKWLAPTVIIFILKKNFFW